VLAIETLKQRLATCHIPTTDEHAGMTTDEPMNRDDTRVMDTDDRKY
jgi:hypothetical protein